MILKPPKGRLLKLSGHPLAKGLVGYWLMNEGSGNIVNDLSGNGNSGTLVANASWVPGKFGPAINLDGTGDLINCGNINMQGWSEISIVVFAKHDSSGSDEHTLASNYDGTTATILFRIEPSDDSVEIFFVTDVVKNIACTDLNVTPNVVHQIAMTYDGTMRAYLNGVVSSTTISSGALKNIATANNFYLGASPHTASDNLTGNIEFALLYNRGLSASEIVSININPFQMVRRDNLPIIVGAAASGAAGGVEYIETGLTIDFSASATTGIDVSAMVDTEKAISLAAATTKTDTSAMIDTNKALSFAASIAIETETKQMTETNRAVSIASTIATGIDVSAMIDTEKALSFAASVTTGIDAKHVADTGLAISFAASITETDIRTFLETNRAVSAAASVSKTDTSAMKDLNKAVSASIFMVKEFTEWYGIGSESIRIGLFLI